MAKSAKPTSNTFNATVTPVAIEKANTVSGVRFSKMVGATVERAGKPVMTRTVMAFGRANAAVARILRAGKPVELACQFDGGTIRVVGRAKKAA